MLIPTEPTIKMGQKFIITERAWFVDEYDATSAPGVTYYSLTEDKIDRLDDDLENELANYKEKGSYQFNMPDKIVCGLGNTFVFKPLVYKNGYEVQELVKYIILDESVANILYVDGVATIIPKSSGETILRAVLVNQPKVHKDVVVRIEEESVAQVTLIGNDNIQLLQTARYEVHKINDIDTIIPIVGFTISEETLATGELKDGILYIYANDKNVLGSFTLTVNTEEQEFTKTITIRSLW